MYNQENKSNKNWSIADSVSTYGIDKWGDKYFFINKKGNIALSNNDNDKKSIDLYKLVEEIQNRDIQLPLILRFNDVLKDRISELNNSFINAIKFYSYQNKYQGWEVDRSF